MTSLPAQLFQSLILNVGMLHGVLTTPSIWSQFANEGAFPLIVSIFQAAQAFNISYNSNRTYNVPSGTFEISASLLESEENVFGGNPAENLTDHAFEAIIGADNFVDIENHVVMEDVLNEIVNITRTVTPTCEWSIRWLRQGFY